jgi:hypothetical protein
MRSYLFALQVFSYIVWFPLKVLGIAALLRVGVRRYPLIFTYSVATFLFAAAEIPLSLASPSAGSANLGAYQRIHWVGEGITYILILAVVISLIYRATARVGPRRTIRLALVAGGFLFIAISFLIHYDSAEQHISVWITPWTRDLNVCAAILDLVLWGLLLWSREKDSTLLLLTGGMGISFTGEAIATSIHTIGLMKKSYYIFLSGHVVIILADAAFLYIWWQTFRKEANRGNKRIDARRVTLGNR